MTSLYTRAGLFSGIWYDFVVDLEPEEQYGKPNVRH